MKLKIQRMTNIDYLTQSLSPMGIEPETIALLLEKGQLSPEGQLEIARCDSTIYRYFSLILGATSQKRREGSFSQSWVLVAIAGYYTALCYELGEKNVLFPTATPQLRDKSNLW